MNSRHQPAIKIRQPTSQLDDPAISDLLKRIYENRGVKSSGEYDYQLKYLESPTALPGLADAFELIFDVLTNPHKKLVIVGDYDVDGATATCLALEFLKAIGMHHVDYFIPDRFIYGYGLSARIVQELHDKGCNVILTVDNGISSIEGVALANELGLKVIITDHHLPAKTHPNADAIINPNLDGHDFKSKALAGVGVIFYVLSDVRARLRQMNYFKEHGIKEPNMADYLDLVCLGTVADVVPLDFNNRILIEQGLRRIRAKHCREGIIALFDVAKRDIHYADSEDLGFAIAPRLNAAGRMESMNLGVECLLSQTQPDAQESAQLLDDVNKSRRDVQAQMHQQALDAMQSIAFDDDDDIIILYRSDWHQGITGLVAGQIKETTQRPCIVFAKDDQGFLKGSARSIHGLHIKDLLQRIADHCPGLINQFGGHAMAAGLNISDGQFDEFKRQVLSHVKHDYDIKSKQHDLLTDGALSHQEMNVSNANLLKYASPWGQDFEAPLFVNEFIVSQSKVVAERHLKMTLHCPEKTHEDISAIMFFYDDKLTDDVIALILDQSANRGDSKVKLTMVYRLSVNRFRGNENLDLMIQHISSEIHE